MPSLRIAVLPVFSVVAGAVMALAGCESRQAQDDVRTVEWYESHPAERAEKLSECMSNPSTRDATPDCVNASRAENNAKSSTRWGTPKDEVRTEPPIAN